MPSELERWRERQLDVYLHTQVIDRLDLQRLLDEYHQAQVTERLDKQNAGLSNLGSVLADTNASIAYIEADVARLLAVTDQYLPAIVDRLALAASRLADISQMLASPRETEALELFRSGCHALTSAIEMSLRESEGLADDWLDEAIGDLARATEIYQQRPDFWFQLGVAYASRGPSQVAAESFSRCARYAVSDSPQLAAESVLLAAAQLRLVGKQDNAKDLLHKFLPALGKCAEIYLNLAVHHGEPGLLRSAFRLDPLLAASTLAEGTMSLEALEAAAADVCRDEDGPVSRLRTLEDAIQKLIRAATELNLDFAAEGFEAATLPEFGSLALLQAEISIMPTARRGTEIARNVVNGLRKLDAEAQSFLRSLQEAKSAGAAAVKAAQEQCERVKKDAKQVVHSLFEDPIAGMLKEKSSAEIACRTAGRRLRQRTAEAAEASRRLAAYNRLYGEDGRPVSDVGRMIRIRGVFTETDVDTDGYVLFEWHRAGFEKRYGRDGGVQHVRQVYDWAKSQPYLSEYDMDHLRFREIALHMIGVVAGDEIRSEAARTVQSAEEASISLQELRNSLELLSERLRQAERRKAGGDGARMLSEAKSAVEADRQRVVQRVKEMIKRAESEHSLALKKTQHATTVINGFLEALDAASTVATASRGRIIPGP